MTLEFRVLGPLQVLAGSTVVDLAGERQRRIVALLLLHPHRVVTITEVIAATWNEVPPPTARRQVHTALWQLRRVLTKHGGARVLLSEAGGYRLDVDPSHVDLYRFEALVAEGRRLGAAGQVADAVEALRTAVALWRGPALAGLDSTVLEREGARLDELRLTAVEDKIDYELALDDNPDLVAELTRLTSEHPLRERLAGALMHALYRAGRQAEALRAYHRIAASLAEELGIDPGRELSDRHTAILRRSPNLDASSSTEDAVRMDGPPAPLPPPAPPVARPRPTAGARPAQLPMDVRGFVGRESELARLDRTITAPHDNGVVVLSAISGTAGVGKTALAVSWAHRVVDAFPDGQLYVDLRGYHPDEPMRPEDALAGFLRALEVTDLPPGAAEQAALFRTTLAGRRMLIVLDNAATAEQVRPLLPGNSSCFVVVTSRDGLAGLVARDGAVRIDLDLLPPHDAVALLRALIGGRVDAEPASAAVLAAQCAWLPLALRVAAELVSARPGTPLSALTDELAELHGRLDRMDAGGDPYTAVRAVLSWSYHHLGAADRRSFRLLGLHPGADLDLRAAAALTGDGPQEARQRLNALVRGHLVSVTGAGRYGMHDLLRAYAAERASTEDDQAARNAALTRLFDHYTESAAAATDLLLHGQRPDGGATGPVVPLNDPTDALVWLDAERSNLVAICGYTAGHGWPEHTVRLASVVWRYLDRGGHHGDALSVHSNAEHAARIAGDRSGEATATTNLGLVHWRRGDNDLAIETLTRSLALSEQHGDAPNEARALTNLGIVEAAIGRYDQAAARLRRAIVCFAALDNAVGKAGAHNNLALVYLQQQRYAEATEHLQETLRHSLATGDHIGEAHARTNLGRILARQHRYTEAAEQHRLALHRSRSTGDRVGEAHALENIGEVLAHAGRYDEAIDHQQQALAYFRATRDQNRETETLNALGETLRAAGQAEQAATHHAAALALATQTADLFEQARAHTGLGHAYRAGGTPHRAHHHQRQARMLYERLGLPQADTTGDLLASNSPELKTGHNVATT